MKIKNEIFLPGGSHEIDWLIQNLDLNNKTILIIGSGSEDIAEYTAKNFNSNIYLILADNDSLARARLRMVNFKNIFPRLMDYHITDFKDEMFDVVYAQGSVSVLERNKIVKEVKRILKPGGHFCVGEITALRKESPRFIKDVWERSSLAPLFVEEIGNYYTERKFKIVEEVDFAPYLFNFYRMCDFLSNDKVGSISEDEKKYYKIIIHKLAHEANVFLRQGGDKYIGFNVLLLEKGKLVKKGDVLELEVTKYAFEGKGIAKINKNIIVPPSRDEQEQTEENYVVFVMGAYPGDRVRASLTKIKKSYSEAKVVEILSPSKLRVPAKCKYFGVCGGCKQQDLNYEVQLKYKQEQVDEILKRIGGLNDFATEEIVASDRVFFYRNKMEFSFAEKRWLTQEEINSQEEFDRNFALGLHIPNMFDKVLDINECFLQSEQSNKILNYTRDFFKSRNISIYTTRNNEGYLRNLVIKQAHHSDDLMVNLVTVREEEELFEEYTKGLIAAVPAVTTVINNINTKKALIALGEYEKVFYGPGHIFDSIGGYKYRISANSFFQTNSLQAEKLYQTAFDFAELTGNENVYDLYSGAGTITIFVSKAAKHVYGFESVEPAVADAKENKDFNNINNVDFFIADLNKSFFPFIEEHKLPNPDVIILDPPRSGMHPNTVEDVLKLAPATIVYVSCNPTTQARDLKLLCEEKYTIIKSRGVDMFPHTYHIENVVLLKLKA